MRKPRVKRPSALHSNVQLDPQIHSSFANSMQIGFCLCDRDLRIRAVNEALAVMNGVPGEQQPGKSLREILGRFASEAERGFHAVYSTHKPMLNEISGKIPTRAEVGYWIVNYFPVKRGSNGVTQVGAVVVEITEQKKLESSLHSLSKTLLGSAVTERELVLDELHRSITRYYSMLKTNLDRLVRPIWDGDERSHLLGQSTKLLDHFPVVSLRHQSTMRTVFEQIKDDSRLRSGFFRDLAASSDLQQEILKLLAKHPDTQIRILNEMAKTLQFRRKLVKLAGKRAV